MVIYLSNLISGIPQAPRAITQLLLQELEDGCAAVDHLAVCKRQLVDLVQW